MGILHKSTNKENKTNLTQIDLKRSENEKKNLLNRINVVAEVFISFLKKN